MMIRTSVLTTRHIIITPDLTLKVQVLDFKLRSELKERRNKGERNPVIRKGLIISLHEDGQ